MTAQCKLKRTYARARSSSISIALKRELDRELEGCLRMQDLSLHMHAHWL